MIVSSLKVKATLCSKTYFGNEDFYLHPLELSSRSFNRRNLVSCPISHPEVSGKVGTHIQDNKCSWLVVQALDRVTLEQRRVLEDWDDVKVMNVKALFKELDMVKVFEDYEI